MTELFEAHIDGVRCFWVDSGRPTLAAMLMFRYGAADEPLHESGWQHLLEHLALHGRGGGVLGINGSVSPMYTTFEAHGPVEQVAAHLTSLSRWLKEPDVSDLERERNVLAAESATRGSAVQRAIGWRYGARGPGVMSYDEPGLGRATAEHLWDRARRVFTQGNAALVLDGPPPTGLSLDLPEGDLLPPRPVVECKEVRPAAYVEQSGLILSGVLPRSPAAAMLPAMLQRALRSEFRDKAGAAYAPFSTYERFDRETGFVVAGTDVSADLLPTLANRTISLVRSLEASGPPTDQLNEEVDSLVQALSDPYRQAGLAFRAATLALEDRAPQSLSEVLAELRGVRVDDLREAAAKFRRSMLAGVPGATTWKKRLPMLDQPDDPERLEGKRHRHMNWPAERSRLVIGQQGVQIAAGSVRRSYPRSEIVGLYTYDNGRRVLVTADGWMQPIHPCEWHDGGRAVEAVDRLIPADRHLPQPPGQGPTHATRMSFLARYGKRLSRGLTEKSGAIATTVIAGAFITCLAGAIATGRPGLLMPAVIGMVIGLRARKAG